MILERAFDVLEIEQTTDKKIIKKAYAKMVRRYHPEEFPDEWKIVHEAYETAIKWADSQADANHGKKTLTPEQIEADVEFVLKKNQEKKKQQEEEKQQETISLQSNEEHGEQEYDFEDIDRLAEENRSKDYEANEVILKKALKELKKVGKSKKYRIEDWKKLFFNEDYGWAIRQETFIVKWGDVLKGRKINYELRRFMESQLNVIQREFEPAHTASNRKKHRNPVAYTEARINSAYRKYNNDSTKIKNLFICLGLLAMIWLFFGWIYSLTSENRQDQDQLNWKADYAEMYNDTEESTEDTEIAENAVSTEETESADSQMSFEMSLSLSLFNQMRKSQYVSEGIYLLDVQDIYPKPESGHEEIKEISIIEMEIPDQISNVLEEEFLVKESHAYSISSSTEIMCAFLWCNPRELGMEGKYRIYSKMDGEYVEIVPTEEISGNMNGIFEGRQRFEVLGYQVFAVQLPVEVIIVAVK